MKRLIFILFIFLSVTTALDAQVLRAHPFYKTPVATITGDYQNLFTYSEQVDNAAWGADNTIVANQALDMLGANTLELLTITTAWSGGKGQDVVVSASTNYTLSFDAKAGTQNTYVEAVVYNIDNEYAYILNEAYVGSLSGSVARLTFDFTTPVGCTNIAVVLYMSGDIGDNIYIGRVQLAETGKDYITTTSTPVL